MQWWQQHLFHQPICDLFVCLKQTPFTLTLRLWDIYILEGERVLTAMAYTILKLHKSKAPPYCIPYGCGGIVLGHPCAADLKNFAGHFQPLGALHWPQKAQSRGGNEMPQGLTCCAQHIETIWNAPSCFFPMYYAPQIAFRSNTDSSPSVCRALCGGSTEKAVEGQVNPLIHF